MIAASEPQEFVPYGRQKIKNHPGTIITHIHQTLSENLLVQQLSQVNIDTHTENEWWTLKELKVGEGNSQLSAEEELYVKDRTATWSQGTDGHSLANMTGDQAAGRTQVCSYTVESAITHALWVNFIKPDKTHGEVTMSGICLLDDKKVSVFTREGEDFLSALQFKVKSAWNTKFGLLLERYSAPQMKSFDNNLATLFSLLHPLDEMAPLLIMKSGGSLQYMNDPSLKLVFTSEDPSLVVLFDQHSGLHSVWKLRKATPQESQVFCGDLLTCSSSAHNSLHSSGFAPMTSASQFANGSSFTPLETPDHNPSPFSFSPLDAIPKLQSPLNRIKSVSWVKATPTSPSPISGRKTLGLSTSTPNAVEARLGDSQVFFDGPEPQPIEPQLTLEYIWTENLGVPLINKGIAVEPAKKVFLSTDMLGQAYLCYLLQPSRKLMVAKLNYTNEKDPETLIGPATAISAFDASPLPGLQMLAVLDSSGGVSLYTGPHHVGKVLVAGVQTALASSSYLTCASTGFLHQSPYPKRSSLLPSAQTGEAMFDERVHLLSPVPALSSPPKEFTATPSPSVVTNTRVHTLRDAVNNRLTLDFKNGSMFRISIPEVCTSPLVKCSLAALKSVLPREVAMQFVTRWYTARNAPGTQDISPQQEWLLFSKILFHCLGYDMDKLSKNTQLAESPDTPLQKKKRSSDLGSLEDWSYLTKSEYHKASGMKLCFLLGLRQAENVEAGGRARQTDEGSLNTSALLFEYFYNVLLSLHLVYEELKLNLLMFESLPLIGSVLQQIARDLCLQDYVVHYFKDFPSACSINNQYKQMDSKDVAKVPEWMWKEPPSVHKQLYTLLLRSAVNKPYPFMAQVNSKCAEMLELVMMLTSGLNSSHGVLVNVNILGSHGGMAFKEPLSERFPCPSHLDKVQYCVYLLSCLGYTRRDLTVLPAGLSLVLNHAINKVREHPPSDWSEAAYRLIGREDLAASPPPPIVGERGTATPPPPAATRSSQETDDGMDSLDRESLKLRFNKDQRVSEVRRLLQSSHPVTIAITQRPEVSDHEFIEEQEKHLYTICTRTMALPVGRGMLTLHTACPVPSEPLSIPRLCLNGRAPPRGTTVDLTHIDVVPNMNLWPLFHNGVAAGLRIAPSATNIDTAWIIFNKPKGGLEVLPEHAGFLMALGLNGHLNNLAIKNVYGYLSKYHEMSSIGLLLGISASKRGTMDLSVTKMLSLHTESLLPPTSVELDVTQNVQVAALLGVGLVYQGTAHRHMAEILLSEMGRPPGPEMENSVDRESYALAAGLALGMVVLGKGSDISSLNDMDIPDTLHYYMVGGHKRPLTGSQKEKYKSPSYQIREGDCVNIAVTSPGATLALGMMYFNTGNRAVAKWMDAPDTQYLLDFVCPDALLLRTVARGLILWEDIAPTTNWVEDLVPETIRPYCLTKPDETQPDTVDLETMNQAYFNIIAGACMAIGLRFAGSCNSQAFETLLHYCKMVTSLTSRSIAELAGKSTIEACLNVLITSLAMVMAGSGDLEVMRLCRFLHSRVGQPTVTYGSHLATHMAIGLLFLGGGRYTLSTSPPAIAALLCAFFPKYPTHSNDNRYHLQALRHLYVLAAESRLLLPRDIDTGSLCYAHILVRYQNTEHYTSQTCKLKAPCILPELKYLEEVKIEDDRYWNITFKKGENWNQLVSLLSGCIGVKQRAGCLSYLEDPHGFRSLLAQTLTTDKAVAWTVPADSIFSFSSDPSTVNFAHYFLEQPECSMNCPVTESRNELQVMHFLTKIVYECVTHDKLAVIPIWITIIKAIQSLYFSPCGHLLWQVKLLFAHIECSFNDFPPPIAADMALSIKQQVSTILESWESDLSGALVKYIHNQSLDAGPLILQQLATYLTFHDFPFPSQLAEVMKDKQASSPLTLHHRLGADIPATAVRKISSLLKISTT